MQALQHRRDRVNEQPPQPRNPSQQQPPGKPTPEDPRKHAPVKDPPVRPDQQKERITGVRGSQPRGR